MCKSLGMSLNFTAFETFLGAGLAAKLSVSAASGINMPVLSFGMLIQRIKLFVPASLVEVASYVI